MFERSCCSPFPLSGAKRQYHEAVCICIYSDCSPVHFHEGVSLHKLLACRFLMQDGAHVQQDQPFAELEAMKQIMLLAVPASGTISFCTSENCALAAGDVVARLELDDPDSVSKGQPFEGPWPDLSPPQVESDGIQHLYADALRAADMLLAGYAGNADGVLQDLLHVLRAPELPFALWEEQWGAMCGLLPESTASHINSIVAAATPHASGGAGGGIGANAVVHAFPAEEVQDALEDCVLMAPIAEQGKVESATARARTLVAQLAEGSGGLASSAAKDLLQQFLHSEQPFVSHAQEADSIAALRREHAAELQRVLDALLSHQALQAKVKLAVGILDGIVANEPQHFRKVLSKLAALPATKQLSAVVQRAQQLLETALLTQLSSEIADALVPEAHTNGFAQARRGSGGIPRNASMVSLSGGQRVLKQAVSQLAEDLQKLDSTEGRCFTSLAGIAFASALSTRSG